MRDFLLITLWGPMSSWGNIAVGEQRPTDVTPTRSALLGLLAAAMGIDRGDRDRQAELAHALSVGARVESSGTMMRDYHTTQVTGDKSARDRRTRTDELTWLGPHKVETILSSRDYMCDAVYTAGYWVEREDTELDMNELARALEHPHWHLSLGRKACPPATPLRPELVRADTFKDALMMRNEPANDLVLRHLCAPTPDARRVVWQGEHGGYDTHEHSERRDEPGDRSRWQFYVRRERRGWHELEEGGSA